MRFHSPEYVAREIIQLIEKYPKIDMIKVMDDLFVIDKKRLKRIAELLRKEGIHQKTEFYVYGRTSLIDNETCKILKSFNTQYINFGLESGSERILSYLKDKSATVKQHYSALDACGRHKLKTEGTFIFGVPGETMQDIEKSFELVRNPNLDRVLFFQLLAYPQNEFWELAKEKGLAADDMDFSDWSAGFHKRAYLNEEIIPWNEFEKNVLPLIQKAYEEKNYGMGLLKIKPKYLLELGLWKRFFQQFNGFSRELIKRTMYMFGLKRREQHTSKKIRCSN